MRAYVFTDERLSSRAGQFVWLSVNTEKEKNAAMLAKHPVSAYPSFLIVDPRSEKALLRYVGGMSVAEVLSVLDEGREAMSRKGKKRDSRLADADALYGAGNYEDASKAYAELLASAPKGWAPYPRALGSYLFSLLMTDKAEDCARAAKEALPRLSGTSLAGLAASGLDCALSLQKEKEGRADLVAFFEKETESALVESKAALAADDVSGVYQVLIAAREDAGDVEGQKKRELEWSAFIDEAAGAAPNAEARTVFDSHRLAAYIATGKPEKAIPMLEASERDLPDDYNPPARLAVAYKELKRYDEALAASDRALAKAYGPRKLLLLRTRSDIYKAKGDAAAARKTLEEALAFAESLPKEQRGGSVESLKKKIAELEKAGQAGPGS